MYNKTFSLTDHYNKIGANWNQNSRNYPNLLGSTLLFTKWLFAVEYYSGLILHFLSQKYYTNLMTSQWRVIYQDIIYMNKWDQSNLVRPVAHNGTGGMHSCIVVVLCDAWSDGPHLVTWPRIIIQRSRGQSLLSDGLFCLQTW